MLSKRRFLLTAHHSLPITISCQAVADADFCFYLQAEGREALAQAINVNVEALRVEGGTLTPGVTPEFFGEDETFDIPNKARDDEKFFERELERLPAAFDVVIGVFDAQITVVINIGFCLFGGKSRLCK